MATFGSQTCGRLEEGATREWLVPDGLGGYAMGTVSGLRTRRYHGLLVVARHLGLASLDAVVTLPSGASVRLATHEWADGTIAPHGHELLAGFELVDGLPRWRWRIGDVVLERELAMVHGQASVAIVHRLLSGGPVSLALEALCTWRDVHGSRTGAEPLLVSHVADGFTVEDAYRVRGPEFQPAGAWWRGVYHREEEARGLTPTEDLWFAGSFHASLSEPGDTAEVSAWAGSAPPPASLVIEAAHRRNRRFAPLELAADAFLVRTPSGPDVVAGYPWFGAWSRDTMLSYEGLFLSTGRADEGRELLLAYGKTLSEGMLANTADTGSVEYNTADGTLWFLHAVDRHVTTTGDTDLAHALRPALLGVIDHHVAGTRYGIRATEDGLLTQGADGEALTWMDARVDGVPVTPRRGKAVDINALWVNALATLDHPLHRTARGSFARQFPAPEGWLYDVLGDSTLRPNQLLAWSLPHAPLEPDPVVLRRIGDALLTPLGLRSQAPGTPGYHGTHRGTGAERDTAYHTGTVWPWLLGPYATAWHRLGVEVVADIDAHLGEYGLGSISETADGDAPHGATGCPFQAWSVAEVLRASHL
ncbi:amylo-alpha-1,6-glucosidase [Actinoplanes bogorensis]|uniref:Amylo-alpha-1,6-glucosidase n=1 Tax=Paractinoplanes bogorensis TaxID=1610840 RepID=A0ABS5YV92_9ACTN|nr:amylo-alpha-1,6-glucosidase [Actinoplanes bogorensis]MBU2666000.1 amylo-alpha-1,6-glucosidase [Actinoplanes bogorensis]